MALISFDENKKRDVVLIGRVTLDFNPNELNRTLDKVKTFSKYLGGSPGNMAPIQSISFVSWFHRPLSGRLFSVCNRKSRTN